MTINTRWLLVSDAAELKGVGQNTLYNYLQRAQQGIAKQRLRYKVISSTIYVSRSDVLALKIKKKRVNPDRLSRMLNKNSKSRIN